MYLLTLTEPEVLLLAQAVAATTRAAALRLTEVVAIIRVVAHLPAEVAAAITLAAVPHLVEVAEVILQVVALQAAVLLVVEVVEVRAALVAVEGNFNKASCINALNKSIGAIFIP